TRIKGRAALSMAPHSAVGGCAPMPRKLRAAADKIAPAMIKVHWTIIGPMELGKMWRNIMRKSPAPAARAADTYSYSRTPMTADRVTRASPGAYAMPTAIVTLVMDDPSAATMAKASKKPGMASSTSTMRITSVRSEEHTSELQSRENIVCRLLLEKKKIRLIRYTTLPFCEKTSALCIIFDINDFKSQREQLNIMIMSSCKQHNTSILPT